MESIRALTAAMTLTLLLFGVIEHSTFAASAQSESPDGLWYLGEGVTENMQLKYRIQYIDTDNGRPFDMTISFKEQEGHGDWVANLSILGNDTDLGSDVVLRESDLFPLEVLGNSISLESYIDAYRQTIQFAAGFATKHSPVSLKVRDWGGLACEGCPKIELHSPETVSVGAGIFNTTLVSYGIQLNLWILDDFPYPVKGLSYESADTIAYSYELLEARVNGIVIPEFEQAFLMLISASILTVIIMRLHTNNIKRH